MAGSAPSRGYSNIDARAADDAFSTITTRAPLSAAAMAAANAAETPMMRTSGCLSFFTGELTFFRALSARHTHAPYRTLPDRRLFGLSLLGRRKSALVAPSAYRRSFRVVVGDDSFLFETDLGFLDAVNFGECCFHGDEAGGASHARHGKRDGLYRGQSRHGGTASARSTAGKVAIIRTEVCASGVESPS